MPPLDESDLASLRAIVREELAAPSVTDRILTTPEAAVYTKHDSPSAFYRWCSRWHVTSSAPGRYARSRLDRALEHESEKRREKKPAPRRPE